MGVSAEITRSAMMPYTQMPQKDIAELANVAILEIEDGCISGDSQIGHDAVAILEIEDECYQDCKITI